MTPNGEYMMSNDSILTADDDEDDSSDSGEVRNSAVGQMNSDVNYLASNSRLMNLNQGQSCMDGFGGQFGGQQGQYGMPQQMMPQQTGQQMAHLMQPGLVVESNKLIHLRRQMSPSPISHERHSPLYAR